MQALLVVDLLQEHTNARLGLSQMAIFRAVDLFVLQGFHERFARGVVPEAVLLTSSAGPVFCCGPGTLRLVSQYQLDVYSDERTFGKLKPSLGPGLGHAPI